MTTAAVRETAPLFSAWDVIEGMRVHSRVSDRAVIRYGRDGATKGMLRAVVFVHGLGMSTRYLEPTMRLAARDFAVSGLDLPGFGESKLRGRVLSLGELARVLDLWLAARGIESPILVGQSHGCQVIVEHVVSAPRSGALVLNAPTMLAGHRSMAAQFARVALDSSREPAALVPHVLRDYVRAGPRRILTTLAGALADRIEEKLPRVAMPVTIVCGARDPVSPPAWGARLARLTGSAVGGAGAELRVVAGAAHAVPFSHPEALVAEIVAIAARLDRAAAPA
ncbi:MAG: alpha/beta fold hydrolase [Gemmatimonadaceae bacterium]